jgi:rhomboid protease GluP
MFGRQKSGSVLCPSCGSLVGVKDEQCYTCGRRYPAMWGFAALFRNVGGDLGFVPLVIGVCGLLYVCTLVVDSAGIEWGGALSFLAPSGRSLFVFGCSGAVPVFEAGRWWTVLSAGWLHAGLLHIVFNMISVRNLAPAMIHLYGPGRTIIIYTIGSVVGFTASSVAGAYLPNLPFLHGSTFTVGASASVFAFIGALVHYGGRGGSTVIRQQALGWALYGVFMGFAVPNIDNWAHLGGFLGGYLASRWLDPLRPEREVHVLAGLACLALSLGSVVYSVVDGLPYFR